MLHLLEAVPDVLEEPIVIVGATEEASVPCGEKFVSLAVVFENLLTAIDEVIDVIGIDKGEGFPPTVLPPWLLSAAPH